LGAAVSGLSLPVAVSLALIAVSGIMLMSSGGDRRSSAGSGGWSLGPGVVVRGSSSLVVALIMVAVTGWVLPSLVSGAATWIISGGYLRSGTPTAVTLARLDALATWVESIRDLLLAGEQTLGAVAVSSRSCPGAIRPQVRRLAAALGRRDAEEALRRFAAEVDDPVADLVAVGLLIAIRRGARTAAVLGALAEQTRFLAERRRLVEAERAPARREVRILTGLMSALFAAVLLAGRSTLLDAYDTPTGQVVLVVAILSFAGLVARTQTLSRFPAPRRFLAGGAT
jgi:Flp pilus assembly protein TadB